MKMLDQFKAARRAGTPFMAIKSFDPEATMQSIQKIVHESTPLIQWDCIKGWVGRNEAGIKAIATVVGSATEETIHYSEHLELAAKLPFDDQTTAPTNPILFVLNPQSYLCKPDFIQALWNLRDQFEASLRSVVLLAPDFDLPVELQQVFLVLDEPLPTTQELEVIVEKIATASGTKFTKDDIKKSASALLGLPAWPAKQAAAMSLTKKGIDKDSLWQRKCQMISATEALDVYQGKETFADIGGCEQVKKFMRGVINGKDEPRVIVFIDEGEKMFAGAASDWVGDNGVNKDALGQSLKFMEDKEADGAIFVGPPGAAKSAVAKATGNEAGIPTIIMDMGAARGGNTTGSAEQSIRQAYKTIDAVGGGRIYFIMTCNKIAVLPPELKRRYTSGIFYFEIPDAYTNYKERAERDAIWAIYIKKYSLDVAQVREVDDAGWTGAEIKVCCRLAYRQNISLRDASDYVIPVSKSAATQIEDLRREASGKYLCANRPGTYQYQDGAPSIIIPKGRMMASLEDE